MASQELLQQIRARIDIVDLIGDSVSLKKMGKYFKAPCPFHQEKTPSFVVSPERQRWHCFGACHEGGDIFSFLMKYENMTFPEAIMELGKKAGYSEQQLRGSLTISDQDAKMRLLILEVNQLAAKYYQYVLSDLPMAQRCREYVRGRGMTDAQVQSFQLGYAPENWDNLASYLMKKGYAPEVIVASGLGIQGTKGIYDRFRGRLMFPIANPLGQIIGFSGRLIGASSSHEQAKYINTPETLIYHKRESLYGIHKSKDAIKKENAAIAVEGEFDMITPYMHGIEHIVAIKGSAFTIEQLKIVKRYTHKLIFALDADEAGTQAIHKTIPLAQELEFEVYICQIPGGKDPDEAVRHDLPAFRKALEKALPVYDYVIEMAGKYLKKEDPFTKKEFAKQTLPVLLAITNPIVKQHYLQKIASLLEVDIASVISMQETFVKKAPVAPLQPDVPAPHAKREAQETYLLMSVVVERSWGSLLAEYVVPTDFAHPAHSRLSEYLSTHLEGEIPSHLRDIYDQMYLKAVDLTATQKDKDHFSKSCLMFAKFAAKEALKKALSQEGVSEEEISKLHKRLIDLEKANK